MKINKEKILFEQFLIACKTDNVSILLWRLIVLLMLWRIWRRDLYIEGNYFLEEILSFKEEKKEGIENKNWRDALMWYIYLLPFFIHYGQNQE